MSYKFDQDLVPNVLLDLAFQSTGIYTGRDGDIFYAVIDPRRHNIDVWTKRAFAGGYEGTARTLGSHFFTNGPQMDPPAAADAIGAIFTGFLPHIFPNIRLAFGLLPVVRRFWRPFGAVISGGTVLDPGVLNTKAYFGRRGAGHFSDYVIANDPPAGLEAIGGLVQICRAGGVVSSPDVMTLQLAIGICAWGLRPIPLPVVTDGWVTEVRYIDGDASGLIDGVLIAAGGKGQVNLNLAALLLLIGVTDAVATDGSDSVMMGANAAVWIPCAVIKDGIQRWGFCCR